MNQQEEWGQALSPRAKTVWAVRSAVIGLGISGATAAAAILWWPQPGVLTGIAAGGALLVLWLVSGSVMVPQVRWRIWRYRIDPDRIQLRRGLLIRTHASIPAARVQHADTSQGPLLRLFGLARVQIFTAGSTHEIPVLPEAAATDLCEQIVAIANRSGDDV
ncbi:PH domain-containing protein [Spirochaeta africana]|uniref:YdbS-like PH domain-containing protein n=1 Tax=Spirochaeta africana (strain ATCC 700263 / DSM 8902 / Z-7692) TaxID=889378 RepID=H9UFG6_SPIAZ|nr:PH domain-containing protein [Spirochaeta africana]AFG36259.1 hypothetical protein Spiaf_0150 [Spirochaeta africana DSM 8902]